MLSEPSLFKLVAVDVFEVPEPTRNIASNPKNRVHQAFLRGETTWCFVMNIMVPGPPHLCFVIYLEGDRKKIEEDTPFGRIARPFFYGHDDEFRNNRFKLIPRVRPGFPPPPFPHSTFCSPIVHLSTNPLTPYIPLPLLSRPFPPRWWTATW